MPEDIEAIEAKMRELASQDLVYERQMWPREEAKRFFGARGEPLKVQLIDEKTEGQSEVSVYTIKDKETFVDFCVGPHVPSTAGSRRSSCSPRRTPTGRATRGTSRCSGFTAPRSSREGARSST